MAKNWKISQTATVGAQIVKASFILEHCETADVSSFCTLLEGGYEVVEVNEAMSDMTKSETNVATSNPVSFIGLYGAKNQSSRIAGFGGKPIHFKQTVSGDDIRNVLKLFTPFELLPTDKAQTITVKSSERVL